jgi:HEPN domain-containing protein/predicted nucleotidyltransferase
MASEIETQRRWVMASRSATKQTTRTSTAVAAIARRIPASPPDIPGSREEIARVVATIAARFHPARVILFGSRASGSPTSESDIDLMVIMETALRPDEQADLIRQAIEPGPPVRVDLHVRTPAQIRLGLRERDFFILDAMNGNTLYEEKGEHLAPNDADGDEETPSGLKQATQEWLGKADENYRSSMLLADADFGAFDTICFLAQQCVEKLLKALLQEREIRSPRTHDLVAFARLCLPVAPALASLEPDLKWLSTCAVEPRYPGLNIDSEGAERSARTMNAARAIILPALGLPVA